jgi:nucleoside-diphosphate-sugar epimerase
MIGVPPPLRATFIPYETMPGKYQDVRHRVADPTKARELLGFETKVKLADGVAATLDWHQKLRLEGSQVVTA